jgi:hypothetical protein
VTYTRTFCWVKIKSCPEISWTHVVKHFNFFVVWTRNPSDHPVTIRFRILFHKTGFRLSPSDADLNPLNFLPLLGLFIRTDFRKTLSQISFWLSFLAYIMTLSQLHRLCRFEREDDTEWMRKCVCVCVCVNMVLNLRVPYNTSGKFLTIWTAPIFSRKALLQEVSFFVWHLFLWFLKVTNIEITLFRDL